MIFWWSEARLASFIEKCISKGRMQNDIDSLVKTIETINSVVVNDERNIQSLKEFVNEHSQETNNTINALNHSIKVLQEGYCNESNPITVDIDELMSVITARMDALSTNVNENLESVGKRIVDIERLRVPQPSQSNIDVDSLAASIKADYIQLIAKASEENNSSIELRIQECVRNTMHVNTILSAHENELKRLTDEIRNNSKEDLLARVIKDYEDEKQKTVKLTEIVQKQSEGIASLSQMVEELRSQVAILTSKLENRSAEGTAQEAIPAPVKILIFDDDVNANKCKLMMLIEHAELLKKNLVDRGMALDDVYVKLVENMFDKLSKLSNKNSEKPYAADKLANETVKILRQTIVKGMTQEKIKDYFVQYMNECGVRKLEWSVGRKITNDDYEYLEEPIMYEEVSDQRLIGSIIEIIQDTYVIDYYDDDEKYEAIIPGLYRIGKGIK